MDLSILTPIAAFGGFALGLANLGITIYKDFFKRSKLEVEVLSFKTRYIREGEYNFQLDIRLFAKNGLVTIKEIKLKNKYDFTGSLFSSKDNLQLYKGVPINKMDISELNPNEFIEAVKSIFGKISFSITDLKIPKDEIKSITFADNIQTIRQSDGYDELPRYKWCLEISYNKKSLIIPLKLEPIGETTGCYSHLA